MAQIKLTTEQYFRLLEATSKDGNFPCSDDKSRACLYRNKDGLGCGIGIIMPNSLITKILGGHCNGQIISALERTIDKSEIKMDEWVPDGIHMSDLLRIQAAHDGLARRGTWCHKVFMSSLVDVPCFSGFRPLE